MKISNARAFIASTLMVLLLSSLVTIVSGLIPIQAISGVEADTSSGGLSAASGSNIFAVWYDGTPGNHDIFCRRGTDNGATWKAIRDLSNNGGNSELPQIGV